MVKGERGVLLLSGVALAGFCALLVTVPRLFPTDPSVLSVASQEGYNTSVAFGTTAIWSTIVVIAAALLRRGRRWVAPNEGSDITGQEEKGRVEALTRPLVLTMVLVVGAIIIGYFPLFLARSGPFQEDAVFINALHRMHGGMQPYRDFEFLYGPTMIAPIAWLTRLTGFSLTTYYAYYAVLEGVVGALIVWWAFRRIPNTRERCVAIIVLLALLLNPFLGLNYNGLRRLLPVIAIAALAVGRDSGRLRIVSAVVAGFTLAYAHEMGTAVVAGAGAVFAVELLRGEGSTRAPVIRDGLMYLAVAVVSWLGFIALALGNGTDDYLRELASLVPRFAAGEAGLTFSWTLNALAMFALLSLGLVLVGAGLGAGRRSEIPPTPGDRFVIASVAVAIVALRSGLTRSDMYHLDTGIIALGMAFLFPMNVRVIAMPQRVRQLGVLCIATLAATYAFGNLPTLSMIARGWMQGARVVLSGQEPSAPTFDPAAPSILAAATAPNPALVGLASHVAAPGRRGKPVLFYGRLWAIGPIIGVYKRDHLNDDFIYSDARGERERTFLEANRDALVLMSVPEYERLWGIRPDSVFDSSEYGMPPSLVKRVASRLSSVHYDAAPLESRLHATRWRRTVGDYVRAHFDSVAAFGRIIVLQRAMAQNSTTR